MTCNTKPGFTLSRIKHAWPVTSSHGLYYPESNKHVIILSTCLKSYMWKSNSISLFPINKPQTNIDSKFIFFYKTYDNTYGTNLYCQNSNSTAGSHDLPFTAISLQQLFQRLYPRGSPFSPYPQPGGGWRCWTESPRVTVHQLRASPGHRSRDSIPGMCWTGSSFLPALPPGKIYNMHIQSGLSTSESVILTNSNNNTDLVGIFFSVILIRYNGKFVFWLQHNKTGNQTFYTISTCYTDTWSVKRICNVFYTKLMYITMSNQSLEHSSRDIIVIVMYCRTSSLIKIWRNYKITLKYSFKYVPIL